LPQKLEKNKGFTALIRTGDGVCMRNKAQRLLTTMLYAVLYQKPGIISTVLVFGLSPIPVILSMSDLLEISIPFRFVSNIFLLASLAGIWYFLFRLNIATPGDRKVLVVRVLALSLLLGVHAATVIAVYIIKIHFAPDLHHYPSLAASLLCLVWMALAVVRRGVRLILAESGVRERAAATPVITPYTGEKIGQAVAFLNDNYKYDISREGLAEKLGMSVDHLSRKFKASMGRRMGDYVNELRVRDAAESLRDTGDRIIDIAYDNGFESLATFNRVFLKIMGETPTEYRRRFAPASSAPMQQPLQECNQFLD